MRLAAAAVAATAMLALSASPAAAEHNRSVPAGLTGTVSSAHFVVHYDPSTTPGEPGMSIAAFAQAADNDLEEDYSHLVTGGGGTPNAGLSAPVPDSDGKSDLYVAQTTIPNSPSAVTLNDTDLADPNKFTSYMVISPISPRGPYRFRAGHEFMHVVQGAYFHHFAGGGWYVDSPFAEAFANWAAEYSFADVDPLDTNFGPPQSTAIPQTPLDCTFGSNDGVDCGSGYWQWLFMQAQVEDYGGDFTTGVLNRYLADYTRPPLNLLDDEIKSQSGNATNLRERFARYARDVWDPTRWTTGSVAKLHAVGPPASYPVYRPIGDTGTLGLTVDHMATRYVRIYNDGGYQPSGPDDEIVVDVGRPAGLATSSNLLERLAGNPGWTDADGPDGGPGVGSFGTNADPALLREIVLPITNDTLTTDNLAFSFRVRYIPGTPTPPANDLQPGAFPALLNQTATSDNVYAGGDGTSEAPSCPPANGATHGVWFRFTTGSGPGFYTYDAQGSDFPAVVSLYEAGTNGFAGCSGNGKFVAQQQDGHTYDIYVGRQPQALATDSEVRLTITAQPTGTVQPPTTLPLIQPAPTPTPQVVAKQCKKKKAHRRAASLAKKKKKKC